MLESLSRELLKNQMYVAFLGCNAHILDLIIKKMFLFDSLKFRWKNCRSLNLHCLKSTKTKTLIMKSHHEIFPDSKIQNFTTFSKTAFIDCTKVLQRQYALSESIDNNWDEIISNMRKKTRK